MRLDSNYARLHIVQTLDRAPFCSIRYDDFDVTVVDLPQNQSAAVYLIERDMPLYEIIDIYREHERTQTHVVFILWCDMLLPDHGDIFEPSEWLRALHALHNKKVYAFRNLAEEVDIFPVTFDPIGLGPERLVKYGTPIDITDLSCALIDIRGEKETLNGRWRMAEFIPGQAWQHTQRIYKARWEEEQARRRQQFYRDYQQRQAQQPTIQDPQTQYYLTLGLSTGAAWDDVRRAYRELARRYHPDLNPDRRATEKMQEINEAYTFLMALYDDQLLA